MENAIKAVHGLFQATPVIAIFLCLAIGYKLGKINFGSFRIGGVAGSLLTALAASQAGVKVDAEVEDLLFALFIYVVGYESGPLFFRSLDRRTLRELAMAACLAASALATVVGLAHSSGLDKGTAAGVAAGGLTQSTIIGTAGEAIVDLGLAADQTAVLKENIEVGFAVTYAFGTLGTLVVCVTVLPWFMKRSIRDDALAAEISLHAEQDVLRPGEEPAVRRVIGRVYRLADGVEMPVEEVERGAGDLQVTVEKAMRGATNLAITPKLRLQAGDLMLLVGRAQAVRAASAGLGEEVYGADNMDLRMVKMDVMVTSPKFTGKTLDTAGERLSEVSVHGVYALALARNGVSLPPAPDGKIHKGDVLTLYGSEQDVHRAVSALGRAVIRNDDTDFVYLGLGLVTGLLIGRINVNMAGLPLTLGSGGGVLLAGLVFGWFRTRRPDIGYIPPGAIQILKELGLAGFVAAVGLSSGLQAVETIREKGISLFFIGALITIVPLLVTMVVGRYVIGYRNAAVMAGALAGSRAANPAFGEILSQAGNSVPTAPFAITYALSNLFLTLLGPLIIALV